MAVTTRSRAKTTTIGRYLLDQLQLMGVDHIFGVPGDYVLQFDKEVENHPIQFINTTRENTSGYMADAYARVRGAGVACITYGVGINIANAISQAYVESSPLIVISGAAGTGEFSKSQRLHHLFNKATKQERDTTQLEIFKKITVAQTVLDNPETAQSEIDRVLEECLYHSKPVYIELPRDRVNAMIAVSKPATLPRKKSDPAALAEALEEIKSILKNSDRPVLWIGHEIHRFGLVDKILAFAEKFHIPLVSSLLGKSAVSEYHPLYMGLYQGKMSREEVRNYVEKSDCLFLLGVILNDVDTGIFTSDMEQIKHKIDLNTETTKIDRHHYEEVCLFDLVQKLESLDLNIRFKDEYPALIDERIPNFVAQKNKKISSERLFACLQKHLFEDLLVISDIGDALFGSAELVVDQGCYFSNAYFAAVGFGIPGAVGLHFANQEKRVLAIVGDGAFQMTCNELSTAARYQADPVIIVLNNHGFATERPLVEGSFNDLQNWDYAQFPRIMGQGEGVRVHTEEDFEKALKKSLAARGAFSLIEVELDKEDFSPALERFCKLVAAKK